GMQSRCMAAYDELVMSSLENLVPDATTRAVSALMIFESLPRPVQDALRKPVQNVYAHSMEERLSASFERVSLCEKGVRNLEASIFADRLNSNLRQARIVLDRESDADAAGIQNENHSLLQALVE